MTLIPTVDIAGRTVLVRDVGIARARDRQSTARRGRFSACCRFLVVLVLVALLSVLWTGCGAAEHHEDTQRLQKQITSLEAKVARLQQIYAESAAEVQAARDELRYAREALERYLARQQGGQ